MSVFKYHAFIYFLRPPPWRTEQYNPLRFHLTTTSGFVKFFPTKSKPRGDKQVRFFYCEKYEKLMYSTATAWATFCCFMWNLEKTHFVEILNSFFSRTLKFWSIYLWHEVSRAERIPFLTEGRKEINIFSHDIFFLHFVMNLARAFTMQMVIKWPCGHGWGTIDDSARTGLVWSCSCRQFTRLLYSMPLFGSRLVERNLPAPS